MTYKYLTASKVLLSSWKDWKDQFITTLLESFFLQPSAILKLGFLNSLINILLQLRGKLKTFYFPNMWPHFLAGFILEPGLQWNVSANNGEFIIIPSILKESFLKSFYKTKLFDLFDMDWLHLIKYSFKWFHEKLVL